MLVTSSPTAADANCAGGGTRLAIGADENDNGLLDADEISSSQVVCGSVAVLTSVTSSGPSANCTDGGTTVRSGEDSNGNGKLDDDEVSQTSEVCASTPDSSLSKTVTLPEGTTACPFGGVRTEHGLDDGANGGVAGDGVLQDGEVDKADTTCTRGTDLYPGTFVPPAGPVGTSHLRLAGGEGLAGAGAGTFGLIVSLAGPTHGGNLAVFQTGTVETAFTMTPPIPNFGSTKFDVTSDKTIRTYASSNQATDGEYYLLTGNSGVYLHASAARPQVMVTGIHVAPNVTLTFPAGTTMIVGLTADIHVEGTVTTVPTGGNSGSLVLTTEGRYIGGPQSKIDLRGRPVPGGNGGSGGVLVVTCGALFDAGATDTSGADGDAGGNYAGGNAGVQQIQATYSPTSGPFEKTGTARANGGSGRGAGGAAAPLIFASLARGLRFDGTIEQIGGKGGAGGGSAAGLTLTSNEGDLTFHGAVTRKGGDVDETACTGSCSGGSVGIMSTSVRGGNLRWNAGMVASGGRSKNAQGGAVDETQFFVQDAPATAIGYPLPAGNMHITGTFDVVGGAGTTGGAAGSLSFRTSTAIPHGQEILFFGYERFETHGGNGTTNGGLGGDILLSNAIANGGSATGSVVNHARLSSLGGKGSAGMGGGAGVVGLQTSGLDAPENRSQAVVSAGPIEAIGGDGGAGGGSGGFALFSSRERVDVSAPIHLAAGRATGANGAGGTASGGQFTAGTVLTASATVDASGGDGGSTTGAGGNAGNFVMKALVIDLAAPLTCAGGKGTAASGGKGGDVAVISTSASSKVASVASAGGAGSPNGTPGVVRIDGIVQ